MLQIDPFESRAWIDDESKSRYPQREFEDELMTLHLQLDIARVSESELDPTVTSLTLARAGIWHTRPQPPQSI